MPILLDGKRRGNKYTFGKKISSKAALLILALYNFSEDVFLLFPHYLLIVSSSFYLLVAELGVGVFDKENVGKNMGDDLSSKA